jgi:hypothetical protein
MHDSNTTSGSHFAFLFKFQYKYCTIDAFSGQPLFFADMRLENTTQNHHCTPSVKTQWDSQGRKQGVQTPNYRDWAKYDQGNDKHNPK